MLIGILWTAIWDLAWAQLVPTNSPAHKLRKLSHEAAQLANEIEPPPPLPDAPSHARAIYEQPPIDISHPSGWRFKLFPPTNTVTLPGDGTLTNRLLRDITLDEFSDMKRTNGTLEVWYFVPR